jgi:oligo-alginate lyase
MTPPDRSIRPNFCHPALLLFLFLLGVPGLRVQAALPDPWPEHPRLIATEPVWTELRARVEDEPELRAFVNGVIQQARQVLPAPTLERRMEGRRLLGVSREALRRILLCSFAYRLTDDPEFLARAQGDMLAAAAFDDWNPAHFLDVAEMAAALAFGYDWLHADLSPETRNTVRRALIDKALRHGRDGHASFRSTNNWSQVCIGGLLLAALAIGDHEPDLARSVLEAARRDVGNGLGPYRPDGVYPEGPSYWEYGTSYTVLLVAALRSATGDDWGILEAEGLKPSAVWLTHMTGPTGAFYNFADGSARAGLMPALYFFARELEQPALLRFQHEAARTFVRAGRERLAPLAAFWWSHPDVPIEVELPLFWSGQGRQPVAAWRSSWDDPDAFYFAIKAGGSAANHAHMDGGSFILEVRGVRWAVDLGLQSYHSLEARGVRLWAMNQDSERWRIFRLGPFSHNTLTIDGRLHDASGMARLVHSDEQGATIDLTPIFLPDQVRRATRHARFAGDHVVLHDTVEGASPGATIRWAMATRAQSDLDDQRVTLRQDGRRFVLQFDGARPDIIDISQPATPLDAPNPGMRMVAALVQADPNGHASFQVTLGVGPAR